MAPSDEAVESVLAFRNPLVADNARGAAPCRAVAGLLLDMGGVLYDETAWRRWLLRLLRQLGVSSGYRRLFEMWDRDFQVAVHRGERSFCDAFRDFLHTVGLTRAQSDEVEASCRAQRRMFDTGLRLLPGVKSTLTRLSQLGFALGAVTDSEYPADVLRHRLDQLGLEGVFCAVISSFDLQRTKPDPRCYLAALEAMRLPAGQVAFVGHDAAELAGAARVGMPTIACNSICMIASGNTVVFNPHPSGRRIAAEGVRRFNEAIHADMGIDNLMCLITEPTLETASALFKHRGVNLITVTGGPGVARAAMQQAKRAIVAGPGNPPVVVDETADLDRAARSIIFGGAYDNNLLCIAEKEVFAVDAIFDQLMAAMERAGAVRLNAGEIGALTKAAITSVGEGKDKHDVGHKDFIGKDAAVLARAAGKSVVPEVEMLFGETDESNPFVPVEQMMPFVPFVRCRNVEQAIQCAHRAEHGFRHTAIIHSNNVRNMTRMGKVMDTTLFVKNGASTAGLGNGGEGYGSYSIAGPTGEGVSTPLTFTRERRCTLVDDLHILGR